MNESRRSRWVPELSMAGNARDKMQSTNGGGDGGGGGQTQQTEEEYLKSLEKEQNERDAKRTMQNGKSRVLTSSTPGESYSKLLLKIRNIKTASDPTTNPLILSLERYSWDSRVHSWSRFCYLLEGLVDQLTSMVGNGRPLMP